MILQDKLGLTAVQADQTVEATIADSRVAPLLKVERVVYDQNRKPIEYVYVLYRADKYFFRVKLKRQRSKESVGWKTI